jgi:hypothetical protein
MPFGIGRNLPRETRKLEKMLEEDPAAAHALTEKDVSALMRGKPNETYTLEDGSRDLVWTHWNMKVGVAFTKDSLFDRIYAPRACLTTPRRLGRSGRPFGALDHWSDNG